MDELIRFHPLNDQELQSPSAATWLHLHFQSLVNELSTSSNFQSTVTNIISMNKILCNGLVICDQATPLDDATQRESARDYQTLFSFYLSQGAEDIAITYLL